MEIWKDIEGYEGLYQVSSEGRVKSLKFGKEKILKSNKNSRDYPHVVLYKEGKIKTFKVHRLVATAFIDNPDNLPQINHINEDKTDNRVDNLEWCTQQYNNNFGTHNEKWQKPFQYLYFNIQNRVSLLKSGIVLCKLKEN